MDNLIHLPQYEEYYEKLKKKNKYTPDEEIYMRYYKAWKKAMNKNV